MGAWTQFPPPPESALRFRPDAIWISHEHSDHFHEPTLRLYDRSTPIYLPAFANGRLEERCYALGFTDVHVLPFGEQRRVHERVAITCFEPGSLWNDASALIEVDDFKILNINDAGLNPRLRERTGAVDIVCSAFGVGASGYPLTWSHIDDGQKKQIIETNRLGMFEMLREAVRLYGPRYVLPFAGHFALWHPSHREFMIALEPTHVSDVVRALSDTGVTVLDLLPGDSFTPARGEVTRLTSAGSADTATCAALEYCREHFDEAEFRSHHPEDSDVTSGELADYLLKLNTVPEILFCEDMTIRVALTDDAHSEERVIVFARVEAGCLMVSGDDPGSSDVSINVPSGVMARLIRDQESWDEAHIGYWCRFTRSPDVYHANFWRLLQAPRFNAIASRRDPSGSVTGDSIIAEVLERLGDSADRVIRRRGMYCVGCNRSPTETLAEGARNHGLTDDDLEHVLGELNALV